MVYTNNYNFCLHCIMYKPQWTLSSITDFTQSGRNRNITTFWANLSLSHSRQKMKAWGFSQILVNVYPTIWCHIPNEIFFIVTAMSTTDLIQINHTLKIFKIRILDHSEIYSHSIFFVWWDSFKNFDQLLPLLQTVTKAYWQWFLM